MSDAAECLHEGRFLRLVRRAEWEYVERVNVTGVAVLVPVTSQGEIVLVEQYRIPVRARMVELPAGLVGDEEGFRGEDILAAANRELDEETGYRAHRLQVLAISPSSGGMTSELVTFVLASDLSKVGKGGGVEGEDIVVHVVPLRDLSEWLPRKEAQGCLIDPKIYAGLHLLNAATPADDAGSPT